jgi:AbrB family looped-hinge helix DNA binding protein
MAGKSSRRRIESRGQLVIPKRIRERHGLRGGSEVAVVDTGDAIHAATVLRGKDRAIVSDDPDFDGVPGLRRIPLG